MINFAFKNGELKEKTQDAIFSLPIKNSNRLLKNRFRIRIPKLGGFRIGIANPNLNTKKLFIFHIIIIWNYLLQKDMFISYWIHHNISPFFYCITVYCSLIFKLLIFRHKWTKIFLGSFVFGFTLPVYDVHSNLDVFSSYYTYTLFKQFILHWKKTQIFENQAADFAVLCCYESDLFPRH